MTLAIDFGFGNIKWRTENRLGIMRSAFLKTANGFLIGEDALRTGRSISIQTVQDLIKFYPVVVERLIEDNGLSYPDVAVGLPLESWQDVVVRTELMNRLNETNHTGNVFVYPQAMVIGLTHGDGLVIDIGHNTVITCLVKAGQLIYARTYYRKGSTEVANRVIDIIKPELAKIGRTLTTVEVDELVLAGRLQLGFDVYELNDEVKRIKQEYIRDVLSMVISDLKVNLGVVSFDTVYLIGGLAKDVEITSKKVQVVVVEDPIFANVNAFYQLANMRVKLK